MKNSIQFLSPRIVGERFDGHSIPLEMLKDLAVLEEMIIEVAKWCYLQDNPQRTRTPRGFTDGISLNLTAIGDGSVVPRICLNIAATELSTPANQIYLERARRNIVDAIDAAEHDQPIVRHLPEPLLGFFDRIGRGLRDGEAIEFNYPNTDKPARLNKITRRKLLLASSQVQEVTEEVSLRGTIPEANQAKMTFELQVINGPRVVAPIAPHYHSTVLKAFNGYCHGARILLLGVGRYNRFDRLQSIETIEHLSLLDSNDIAARLDELRALKNGWLDGKGFAPASEGLDWLANRFESLYPDDLPLPYLYPTAEGGIQAEWSLHGHEITLEISLDTHRGEWNALNMETEEAMEQILDLDEREGWDWLATQIQPLSGASRNER
ncbi:MAG: hypothetical protein WCP34_17120 [Pseudomonadota bacterium]